MLTLINGDGNPRVTAAQDADWYGSLTGEKTCIMPANDKFSATVADANTIEISSGVLITKEGRRVQIDAETIEEIIIPTGTQGTDTYYIIGFHLYIDESGQQVAETFVETMENESDTITETTFREGSTSIYISLYRVKRNGLTLESVTRICPMYELSADEIVYGNTNVGSALTQINSDLIWKLVGRVTGSATINIPASFHELHVVVKCPSANEAPIYVIDHIINKSEFDNFSSNFNTWLVGGGAISNTNHFRAITIINATHTAIGTGNVYVNNVDYLPYTVTELYYR